MCSYCLMGFHRSCINDNCPCAVNGHAETTDEVEDETEDDDVHWRKRLQTGGRRAGKRTALLKDEQSTGRKRAARLFPLNREAPCEWRNKDNCGGGLNPVLGCLDGNQQARHHGPDKNVINNEEGNVHRICHSCHYRWHVANDATYDWNKSDYPSHAPVPMPENKMPEAALNALITQGNRRIKD